MLAPAVQKGHIDLWSDQAIPPGRNWIEAIRGALLLVSQNFLASHFIALNELPPLLKAAKNEGVIIYWIYVSSCLFEQTEIASYQAAHDISRPLDRLPKSQRQAVLAKICANLVGICNSTHPSNEETAFSASLLPDVFTELSRRMDECDSPPIGRGSTDATDTHMPGNVVLFDTRIPSEPELNDPNESNWAEVPIVGAKRGARAREYRSIDGFWRSRWTLVPNKQGMTTASEPVVHDWHEGTAFLHTVGDWVLIEHQDDTNRYVIRARRVCEKRLVGRYMNAGHRTDTHPWVGIIVNNHRIDGYWPIDRDYITLVRAPAPAVVVSIAVQPGDEVATGDRLAVIEAMKMEAQIVAPFAGKISQVIATPNTEVSPGDALFQMQPTGAERAGDRLARWDFRR